MIALRGVYSGGERNSVALRSVAFAAVACLACACSEEQYNPTLPTGGSSGVTATAGSGGSSGSGSSGAGGSAGMPGSAGSTGSAGSGSSAVTQTYAFASGVEGFAVNYACPGPTTATCAAPATGPAPEADAGSDGGDAAPPEAPSGDGFYTLEQDGAVGDPQPGSLKLTLQLSTGTQSANVAINYATGVSLMGKTVRAQVRVEAGSAPITAKMYIKTGPMYYYADGGQVTLVAGSWISAQINPAVPSYPTATDPTMYLLGDVREIGIEIGTTAATAAPAIVHIDTLSY